VSSEFVQVAPDLLRWNGAGGTFDYEIDPSVFIPTLTSEAIVDALQEMGELGLVLDAGCGGGFLAIVAARLGATRVIAIDVSANATRLARRNVARAGVADRVSIVCADGLDAVRQDQPTVDVFVNDVSGVPDVVASRIGWYPGGSTGNADGITLPIRFIEGSARVLRPEGGRLVQPLGSVQFTPAIRRRLDQLFSRRTIAAYRHFFLPKQQFSGDLGDIAALRAQGRMRLWEARGMLWWDAEVQVCEGLRRPRTSGRP
jgi:SAM-dependent methyltransferase